MHQRHSAKSVPPALIDEGRRYFFYDGDDQLTQVVVSNAWMTDFQYDGQRRLRIAQEYTWRNKDWTKTNELRYAYDEMLVIQERDANNLPIKTYTRGLDLSGSLQGAGGIGGLLAMTDHKDISARHYYYHSDANGNVTALINEQQVVMARYAYDPFGNQIMAAGPVSGLNLYRFSSKEWHPNSRLYYYGYRFYEPNLQRWINQDPIGEVGGLNLSRFVINNSINRFDKDGRLCTTKIELCHRAIENPSDDIIIGIANIRGHTFFRWPESNGRYGSVGLQDPTSKDKDKPEEDHPKNARACRICEKVGGILKYGSLGAGNTAANASESEVINCLKNRPIKGDYNGLFNNCNDWTKGAAEDCGLVCSGPWYLAY